MTINEIEWRFSGLYSQVLVFRIYSIEKWSFRGIYVIIIKCGCMKLRETFSMTEES